MSELKERFPGVFDYFRKDEFAASTFINKYLLRDGQSNFVETDPVETVSRVCKALAAAMPTEKPTEEWLKRVLKEEYDPTNPDRTYTWEEIFIKAVNQFRGAVPQGSVLSAAGNPNYIQSLSNCFVIPSPEDSIASIFKAGQEQAQLMKRRGGVGMDLSTLRPLDAPVANAAGSSSGAVGWADYHSNVTRAIGQNGRRGAQMLTLDVKHPDAAPFARAKSDRTKITGANLSLRLSDEFMRAVVNKEDYVQQWPVDSDAPQIKKTVKAEDLWQTITHSAWADAEPGLIFWDNALRELPAHRYPGFKSISTNPCSEIILSAYDSCRLLTNCLVEFVKRAFLDGAEFDFAEFEKVIRISMRMMDAIVSCEIEAIKKILNKIRSERLSGKFEDPSLLDIEEQLWVKILWATENGRRCGLGTHGLADTLVRLGVKYDSDEAMELVNKIYETLKIAAYDESAEMAIEYGAFPVFDWETEKDCPFIQRLPEWLKEKIAKAGRRNISILTNAPTGTISIISRVSSGLEPIFRLMYIRRRKVNANDPDARVDFVDDSGDKWQNHRIFHTSVQEYLDAHGITLPDDVSDDTELRKYLPDYFVTSDKIDWRKRIKLQGIMQSHIDHSISSTINLPKDTPREVVSDLYLEAWSHGLKGVTVYRDGCRDGVLVTEDSKLVVKPVTVKRVEAPDRPDVLPCEVHITKVQGEEWVVIVGLLNGTVYEIFCGEHKNHIPSKSFKGWVRKVKKKTYVLEYIVDGELQSLDINKYFKNEQYQGVTRMLSMALRHGTPMEFIIQQLQRASFVVTGFEAAVSRILKKYIKIEDMQRLYKTCSKCESSNILVKHEDGCFTVTCFECNHVDSKCS